MQRAGGPRSYAARTPQEDPISSLSIVDGTVVSFNYTLTNDAGEILDSSDGGEPLVYLHGGGNIVPGLEKALTGHLVGDRLRADVIPSEGYGERQGPGPQPFPKAQFPAGQVHPGMRFFARGPQGEQFAVWVVAVDDEHVFVDVNHPLAGQTLHFDVEITSIRLATEEEIGHGHPHGPDGHDHHH